MEVLMGIFLFLCSIGFIVVCGFLAYLLNRMTGLIDQIGELLGTIMFFTGGSRNV